jgi:hypothetical protein
MTSLAIAKLVIDGILLLSLSYVAFRLIGKQQPSTIANLARLKELEISLKEVIRDADDAGRSLSDDLLGRKRDLEKVLTEVEGAESRINKSKSLTLDAVELAKEAQEDLEKLLKRSLQVIESEEAPVLQPRSNTKAAVNRLTQAAQYSRTSNSEQSDLLAKASQQYEGSLSFNYNKIPEPPSFTQRTSRAAFPDQQNLRQQVEVDYSYQPAPANVSEAEDFIPDSPQQEEQLKLRKDPRLGVLGALSKGAGVY